MKTIELTDNELDVLRSILNKLITVETKTNVSNPFKGLHECTVDIFKALYYEFGNARVLRKDPKLEKILRKYYVKDFDKKLNKLEINGGCKVIKEKFDSGVNRFIGFELLFELPKRLLF